MPFKSKAQRKFMHARHPEIAERWEHESKTRSNLPEHVKRKAKSTRKSGRRK